MADRDEFSFRSVAAAVYLPTLLFGIGEGALIPLIPAAADNVGATIALAGLIAAMLQIGELFGDIPSGALVARVGERAAMIGAVVVALGAAVLIMFSPEPFVLGLGVFVLGLATAVFGLARHAFMTTYVPIRYRARSLSLLGGVTRAGRFVGPLISAPIIHLTGGMTGVYWTMVLFCLVTAALLIVLPDPETTVRARTGKPAAPVTAPLNLQTTIRQNGRVLGTVGVGAAVIAALRSSRLVIIPLWAVSIGVDEATTSLIIGVTGAVDFALFYVSGHVMDRFGRIWGALPPLVGMGSGLIILSLSHDLPNAVSWLWVIAALLAIANGMSSGVLMTLGADLADPRRPAPFLGAWRFVTDAGAAASPVLIAVVTALASLAAAAASLGAIAAAGVVIMWTWLPRGRERDVG